MSMSRAFDPCLPRLMRAQLAKRRGLSGPPRPGRRVAALCPCLSGETPRAPLQKLRLGHWLCLELVPPTRVLCRDAHTAVNWPDHIGRIPAIRNSPTKTSPRGAWVWTLVQPTGKEILFSRVFDTLPGCLLGVACG